MCACNCGPARVLSAEQVRSMSYQAIRDFLDGTEGAGSTDMSSSARTVVARIPSCSPADRTTLVRHEASTGGAVALDVALPAHAAEPEIRGNRLSLSALSTGALHDGPINGRVIGVHSVPPEVTRKSRPSKSAKSQERMAPVCVWKVGQAVRATRRIAADRVVYAMPRACGVVEYVDEWGHPTVAFGPRSTVCIGDEIEAI